MNNNPQNIQSNVPVNTNAPQIVPVQVQQPVVYTAQPQVVYAPQPVVHSAQPVKKQPSKRTKKLLENTSSVSSWMLFILSLIYGTLFTNILFSNGASGLGLTLLVIIYYCFFTPFIVTGGGKSRKTAWLLLAPVLVLAVSATLFASTAGRAVAILLMLVLMPMQLMLMGGCSQNRVVSFRGFTDIFRVFFGYTFANIGASFRSLGKNDGSKKGNGLKVFLGLVISIPVLIVLISIFASADAAFAHFVDTIVDFINLDLSELVADILIGAILAVFIFSNVLTLRSGYSTNKKEGKKIQIFDSVITATVLFAAAVVYLIFVFIQIEYLFVGAKLPADLTYAEYVHKGVFELSLAIFLTFVVCAAIRTWAKRNENGKVGIILRAALSVITLATFVICISAFYRIFLYIDAYGLTVSRVAAVMFILGMTLALLALVAGFWIDKLRIAPVVAAIVIFCICAFNIMNVDRVVAKVNVDRHIQSGKNIDIEYIAEELSCGTMPEIERLYNNAQDEQTKNLAEALIAMYYYDGSLNTWDGKVAIKDVDFADWTFDHQNGLAIYKAAGSPDRETIEYLEDFCNRYYYW